MKKRGQLPNSQTYAILLNGCAKSSHKQLALAEAVKIYTNLSNSVRLEPNTTHLNILLNVCAKAGDLETMFNMVKTAQARQAPDNITYSVIFEALYKESHKYITNARVTEEEKSQIKTNIGRARDIWEEVTKRWRAGALQIDEWLVCAIGKVLLTGDHEDNELVLSLVTQTMGIPNLVNPEPILSSAAEGGESNPEDGGPQANDYSKQLMPRHNPTAGLVNPSYKTLSLVLRAISNTGKTSLAPRYWDLLTSPPYSIKPEYYNWSTLLMVMRRAKNSSKAVEYLKLMPRHQDREGRVYKLAIGACLRDNLNEGSFRNATEIVHLMEESLDVPDLEVLRIYLRCAHASKALFKKSTMETGQPSPREQLAPEAKLKYGGRLIVALEVLFPMYRKLSKSLAMPENTKDVSQEQKQEWADNYPQRAELVALARKMHATYDMLAFEGLTPDAKTKKRIEARRRKVARYVTEFFGKSKELGTGHSLRKRAKASNADKGWEEDANDEYNDEYMNIDQDDRRYPPSPRTARRPGSQRAPPRPAPRHRKDDGPGFRFEDQFRDII